jgi:hypothetical protein
MDATLGQSEEGIDDVEAGIELMSKYSISYPISTYLGFSHSLPVYVGINGVRRKKYC